MNQLLEKRSLRCLDVADVEYFYKLQRSLFLYANKRINLVQDLTHESLRKLDVDKVLKLRSYIFDDIDTKKFIDEFIEKNPEELTEQDLSIISSWKNFMQESFLIYKAMKDYHVFLYEDDSDYKAYAVKSLLTDISEVMDVELPVFVQTILLPFKGLIVYDNFLLRSHYTLHFGSGIKAGFQESFEQAKISYGIISSLPFNPESIDEEHSLREMMSSKRKIENYWHELQAMRSADRELEPVYQECINKAYASHRKKTLKSMGIERCYFSIYDGYLLSTAVTKDELIKNAQSLLGDEKAKHVHYAKL